MYKQVILIISIAFCCSQLVVGKKRISREEYINKYKNLAIKEMKRTGIPASITLAQGILESDNGNSKLARKGNNHFGIKCHDDWKGERIRHNDDKRKECFRSYDTPYESFKDHSRFLLNGKRYQFLFSYSQTDYKSWAKGLQKAGYATSKSYAKRLIKIIEENKLYQYDTTQKKNKKQKSERKNKKNDSSGTTRKIYINNRTNYIIVQQGDTYKSIADEFALMEVSIYKFNDLPKTASITAGQKVYIQPKKNKAEKGKNVHMVKSGDTMYMISQKYAIKLNKLYELNGIKPGSKLSPGQKIRLY